MMKLKMLLPFVFVTFAIAQTTTADLALPAEKHLRNIRQITFGGENAEAYFSADDKWLIFQRTPPDGGCDQIYILPADDLAAEPKLVSNGKGKTTCSYVFPDDKKVLFSSTHLAGEQCPPRPDYSKGYVWPVHAEFDIFTADLNGAHLKQLTKSPGYDAEATIRRDGRQIVFTSARDGDLEIYTMDGKGKHVKRLTHELGYDGGPFFSADGKKIVYRASRPADDKEANDYRSLLKQNLIRPGRLDIWVMHADGSGKHKVTDLPGASFAPFWHPDGKRIIFSSNHLDPRGRNFDLYMVNEDGTGLERITFSPEFDGFPMFTSDGKRLVFASNRNAAKRGDTNIFIADWVD
jgi:TolB protein